MAPEEASFEVYTCSFMADSKASASSAICGCASRPRCQGSTVVQAVFNRQARINMRAVLASVECLHPRSGKTLRYLMAKFLKVF